MLTHWGRGRTPPGVFQTERSSPAEGPSGSAAADLTDPLVGQKHTITHPAMQADTMPFKHLHNHTSVPILRL